MQQTGDITADHSIMDWTSRCGAIYIAWTMLCVMLYVRMVTKCTNDFRRLCLSSVLEAPEDGCLHLVNWMHWDSLEQALLYTNMQQRYNRWIRHLKEYFSYNQTA
jgi:hypothetical protein